jgi:hypothetical protein
MRRLTLLMGVVVVVAVAVTLGVSGAASFSGSAKARWVADLTSGLRYAEASGHARRQAKSGARDQR